jgi:adenosylcobalamin-dependent ribonucleoside-triphosphate reductase
MFDIAKRSFDLPESFLKQYKNKQPDWSGLSYFTFKRTYARAIEGENRSEEWWETCQRVVEGTFSIQKNHCAKSHLPWDERKAQRAAKRMFELMWGFRFLPPGRGLWMTGTDFVIKKGSACLQNCGFTSTKYIDVEPTTWAEFIMDMSMLGVGIGFDTRGVGKIEIKPIPKVLMGEDDVELLYNSWNINKVFEGTLSLDPVFTFKIHDTREGWVASLRILLSAYFRGQPLPEFDYSKIREAGKPIKGFGGTSSGPQPLMEMHRDIKKMLDDSAGQKITSTHIVDIGNLIGRCVVAGNVRRSSEIVFGDPDDKEYALLKQDKEKLNAYRWNSNNSIFAKIGMDYGWHAKQTAINGEPGYCYLDNMRAFGRMKDAPNWKDKDVMGGNPCLEQSLFHMELCNLVETFPAKHDSLEEYLETLKIAYLYAKTITLVPTHWKKTNAVMTQNRRIGLSQSGIIRAFGRHGRHAMREWCDKGYEFIQGLDIQYSNWLGVPRSIKTTSVKPSGTVSLLASEPPGIHYPHSEYYIRRIRVGLHSKLWKIAKTAGYKVEPAIGQESTTMVVEFPVKENNFVKGKSDVTIWEQVQNAVFYQKFWADNQVSITVSFKATEADEIQHVLELNEDSLKGISFLPLSDHGYQQAPYEEITKQEYDKMVKNIKVMEYNQDIDVVVPKFCDSDTCEI